MYIQKIHVCRRVVWIDAKERRKDRVYVFTFFSDRLVGISRFCARGRQNEPTEEDIGTTCEVQTYGKRRREVCFCNNRDYCNIAAVPSLNFLALLLCMAIGFIATCRPLWSTSGLLKLVTNYKSLQKGLAFDKNFVMFVHFSYSLTFVEKRNVLWSFLY